MGRFIRLVLLMSCIGGFPFWIQGEEGDRLSHLVKKSEKLVSEIDKLEERLDVILEKMLRMKREKKESSDFLSVTDEREILNVEQSSIEESKSFAVAKNSGEEISLKLFKKGYRLAKQGNYWRAIDCFYDALKYSLKYADKIYYNLGYVFTKLGEYQKAVACFQKALSFGEDKDVYYNLAVVYARYLNDLEKAEIFYKKFLSFP